VIVDNTTETVGHCNKARHEAHRPAITHLFIGACTNSAAAAEPRTATAVHCWLSGYMTVMLTMPVLIDC